MTMIARTILVEGRVQGVFFRDWTVMQAESLGLSGWVRNRRDGRVEVYAVGEPGKVHRLIDLLHEGSPASRVDNVAVEESAVETAAGFVRRPTF